MENGGAYVNSQIQQVEGARVGIVALLRGHGGGRNGLRLRLHVELARGKHRHEDVGQVQQH
jgi:hypothetical protein